MVEAEVEALRDTEVRITNRHRIPGFYADTLRENRTVVREDGGRKVQRTEGSYNHGADRTVATSVFLCGEGFSQPEAGLLEADLRRGEKASFALVGIVCTTGLRRPVERIGTAGDLRRAGGCRRTGCAAHERAWDALWQSDIVIEGDDEAQRAVRFALFNLYGSVREGSRRSVAPMGLTSAGYGGHIFWDAETWIFPPLLVLHPELARQMLDYRTDRIEAGPPPGLCPRIPRRDVPVGERRPGRRIDPDFRADGTAGTPHHGRRGDCGLAILLCHARP